MAVDYTVHLMHSYHESSLPTRFERARAALTEMGVSVFSGAMTTFFASCPLMGAVFLFFVRFGVFIAMITIYSILWAIFFLMTLSMAVGPELTESGHLHGEIKLCKRKETGNKQAMEVEVYPSDEVAKGEVRQTDNPRVRI